MAEDLIVKRVGLKLGDGDSVVVKCAVQMFDFDKAGQPKYLGFFAVNTRVYLDLKRSQQAIEKGFKFYYVRGSDRRQGYIPKAAFHDFVAAQLDDTPYTGVSYGGDKWTMDGKGNLLAFPEDKDGHQPCDRCGGSANMHKLMETKQLASMVKAMVGLLEADTHFTHDQFMLAGLRTAGDRFAIAYSGTLSDSNLTQFKARAAELDERPVVARMLGDQRYASDLDRTHPFPRQWSGWSCAGPRAVQCAWTTLQDVPIELSEKWYGKQSGMIAISEHTIKSCNACRGRLPYMLCGVAFWRL